MVIQNSNVAMSSKRQYHSQNAASMSYSSWGNFSKATLPTAKEGDYTTSGFSTKKSQASFEWYQGSMMYTANGLLKGEEEITSENAARDANQNGDEVVAVIRKKTVDYIMSNQMSAKVSSQFKSIKDIFEELLAQHRKKFRDLFQTYSAQWSQNDGSLVSISPTQEWGASYSEESYYEESEQTKFQTKGQVTTADGRTVDFNVDLYMSRSFMEYSNYTANVGAPLLDPLVINLEGAGTEIGNQEFLFDIDCDGEMDNISILKETSGFLALDRNNDNKINDGSELFGAKSGDGFSELTVYDMDGNGWIDENDPIFDKLRIWTKSPEGEDKLIGLGVAGVGAIYLGNANTEFHINNEENETLGVVRKTGIFLKEDGNAGTIQQVDLAKRQAADSLS